MEETNKIEESGSLAISGWQGVAGQVFAGAINNMHANLEELNNELSAIAELLIASDEAFKAIDNILAQSAYVMH